MPAAEDLSRDPLTRRVIEAIARTQGMKPAEISPDSTFEELGFDSLDGFEILFSLEEEFDLMISDEDAREIASIRQAVECLRPLVAEKGLEVAEAAEGGDET